MIIGDHMAAVCSSPLESSCFNLSKGAVNPPFELPVLSFAQLGSIVSVALIQMLLAVDDHHQSERCVLLNFNREQFQISGHHYWQHCAQPLGLLAPAF